MCLGFCCKNDFGLLHSKWEVYCFRDIDSQFEARGSFMESEKIDGSRVVVRMLRFDFQFGMSLRFAILDEMRMDSRYMMPMLDLLVRMKERSRK